MIGVGDYGFVIFVVQWLWFFVCGDDCLVLGQCLGCFGVVDVVVFQEVIVGVDVVQWLGKVEGVEEVEWFVVFVVVLVDEFCGQFEGGVVVVYEFVFVDVDLVEEVGDVVYCGFVDFDWCDVGVFDECDCDWFLVLVLVEKRLQKQCGELFCCIVVDDGNLIDLLGYFDFLVESVLFVLLVLIV